MASPASAITCSTLARLPGWCTVSTMRISGIFMAAKGAPTIAAAPPVGPGCHGLRIPAIMRAPRRGPDSQETAVATAAGTAKPAAAKSGGAAIDPLDFYAVRAALSEEERMVQDSVARLVDDEVLPIIQQCFEEHRFPQELVPELAELGLLGSSIQGYELRRPQRRQLRAHLPGARARRLGHPQLRLGAVLAVHVPDLRVRLRGAEAALPAAHGARRAHRLLRAHRAARRLRPGQHEDARQAARRRLGAERRRRCGSPTAAIADLAVVWAMTDGGHPRLPRREGHAGVRGAARSSTSSRCAPRSPPALFFDNVVVPESQRAARRGRPQGPAVVPDAGALRHRLGRDRRGAGLPARSCSTTRATRDAVRPAARRRTRRSRSASPRWHAASPPRSCWRCSSGA